MRLRIWTSLRTPGEITPIQQLLYDFKLYKTFPQNPGGSWVTQTRFVWNRSQPPRVCQEISAVFHICGRNLHDMFFPSLTTQLWSSSHHNSTVKTCQYCFFLTSREILKWELLPKTLPLAEASGNYRHPACFGTITSQHPGASKKYFPLLSAMTKGTKVLLGDCCHWCSPCIHLWQSHKCVQKALFEEVPVSLARQLICLFSNTEKFIFLFKRSVWQTNLIDPKACYFTLWPSALLFRVLIRIWPWCQ